MKLAEVNQCTGCSACASICPNRCIHMEPDAEGFLRPTVENNLCVDCSLCEKVCPVMNVLQLHDDPPVAYAAYTKDETIRLESSSGGIFSELARAVLTQSGVVFGAAYNEQFDVVHICVEDEKKLFSLRSAKYVQSDLNNTFTEVKSRLDKGQQVLFSGTPCQVAGLKFFLQKEYPNLITVDFICHGVPSPMVWKEYVKYRAQQDNNGRLPFSINMRSKETGWSRYRYSNLFRYPNGTSYTARSDESLFMKLFVGNFISRESCSVCSFKGYNRYSDLTIGDFWGIWDISPEMDDDMGTSVVLCQSARGTNLLASISDQIVTKRVTLDEVSRHNNSMLTSSPPDPRRKEAIDTIIAGNIPKCENWFRPSKHAFLCKFLLLVNKLRKKGE